MFNLNHSHVEYVFILQSSLSVSPSPQRCIFCDQEPICIQSEGKKLGINESGFCPISASSLKTNLSWKPVQFNRNSPRLGWGAHLCQLIVPQHEQVIPRFWYSVSPVGIARQSLVLVRARSDNA